MRQAIASFCVSFCLLAWAVQAWAQSFPSRPIRFAVAFAPGGIADTIARTVGHRMSERVGPVAVLPSEANGPLLPGVSEVSQATQQTIDDEVRRIVEEAHGEVTRLLTEHRDKLESLTERLMEKETLDMDEAYEAAGVPRPRAPEVEPLVS